MINMRKFIMMLVLMCFTLITKSQGFQYCMNELRSINKAMGELKAPEGNNVYQLTYNQMVSSWDSEVIPNKVQEVEILLGQNQMHYYSQEIVVLQDNFDSFMIVEPKMTIIRNHSVTYEDKSSKVDAFVAFRDSILDLCVVRSCNDITIDGKKMKQMKLVPSSEKNQRILKIVSTEIICDPQNNWIDNVVINYTESNEIKQTRIKYKKVDYQNKQRLKKTVAELVVNKDNQLLKKYKGYKYFDQRK